MLICPHCGYEANAQDAEFCAMCYHPFKKMDAWGEIRSPTEQNKIHFTSKIWRVPGWIIIVGIAFMLYKGWDIYYNARLAQIDSALLNNVMKHKETVVRMRMAMADNAVATEQDVQKEKVIDILLMEHPDTTRPVVQEIVNVPMQGEITGDFIPVETPHFIIYCNNRELQLSLTQSVEKMFNTIITDLGFFTAWVDPGKMKIYVFKNAQAYHASSGLPAWSAGYASADQAAIYLYEGSNFPMVFPHELTHLIFNLFMGNTIDLEQATWINEGIAVYEEMRHNPDAYENFDRYMKSMARTEQFMGLDAIANLNVYRVVDQEITRLWYYEAGSVIKFLIEVKGSMAFYNFCNGIRLFQGDILAALRYAYADSFTSIKKLETAWLEHLAQF